MGGTGGTATTPFAPDGGPVSHRTALLGLGVLTAAAIGASRVVETLHTQSLLPWVALATGVIAWTFRRPRQVDLFDPVVFVSWTHYAPVYVVGAFLLAAGIVPYPYAGLIPDAVSACALALLYIVIGYLALRLGGRWQGVGSLATRVARLLPAAPAPRTIPLGAILCLVAIGAVANYEAFRVGIIGFAIARPPGPFDAAASYTAALMSLGHFLFWFRWFDPQQVRPSAAALVVPLFVVVFAMTLNGNRGALFSAYLTAAFAYRLARGRLTLRQHVVVVTLAFLALGAGMVFGTAFRILKGGETGAPTAATATTDTAPTRSTGDAAATPRPGEKPGPAPTVPRPSLTRQFEMAAATTRSLASDPGSVRAMNILATVGQRLNLLSDLSVAVARYRQLRPLEAEAGVADLWTMTWTSVVPRALWPGKPRVGNVRAFSALYFGWDGNSYAWTPPGDLIRNVGTPGMPLGMAVLGVVLGTLSAALVGFGPAVIAERGALFAMLLVTTNLEGPYGLLLPTMLRIGVVVLFGLGVVRAWSWRLGQTPQTGEAR